MKFDLLSYDALHFLFYRNVCVHLQKIFALILSVYLSKYAYLFVSMWAG